MEKRKSNLKLIDLKVAGTYFNMSVSPGSSNSPGNRTAFVGTLSMEGSKQGRRTFGALSSRRCLPVTDTVMPPADDESDERHLQRAITIKLLRHLFAPGHIWRLP